MKIDYTTKEYHQQRSKDHYQKYKLSYNERAKKQKAFTKAFIREAKTVGCRLCPEKDPICLDFHHLHSKDKPISTMHGMNEQRVREEMSKCVILCSNCHRKVHAGIKCLGDEVRS